MPEEFREEPCLIHDAVFDDEQGENDSGGFDCKLRVTFDTVAQPRRRYWCDFSREQVARFCFLPSVDTKEMTDISIFLSKYEEAFWLPVPPESGEIDPERILIAFRARPGADGDDSEVLCQTEISRFGFDASKMRRSKRSTANKPEEDNNADED